jgi:hypothetical protein
LYSLNVTTILELLWQESWGDCADAKRLLERIAAATAQATSAPRLARMVLWAETLRTDLCFCAHRCHVNSFAAGKQLSVQQLLFICTGQQVFNTWQRKTSKTPARCQIK